MKLYNLSHGRGHACYVMRSGDVTVMFDCDLDPSTLALFLPLQIIPVGPLSNLKDYTIKNEYGIESKYLYLKELNDNLFIDSQPEFITPAMEWLDISSIDVVLISNFYSMLALPFLAHSPEFNGTIYMTEPTLQFGRLIMEELLDYVNLVQKPNNVIGWKETEGISSVIGNLKTLPLLHKWTTCYNMEQLTNCLSQVEILAYNEMKDIAGGWTIQAISSGYAIGSCNWIAQSNNHKICYVNSSSSLTTHPKNFEQSPLKNSDVLIFNGLTKSPRANPDAMITEFCTNIVSVLSNGGNVLVPCISVGIVYDLIECLSGHLEISNLGNIPFYFISPLAKSSLAYSNIYAEWLSSAKQSKVFLPDCPFLHADLLATNRLKVYKSIYDGYSKEGQQPGVVFTGHPSLRFGDVVHFMQVWKNNAKNLIMFTDPEYSYIEALAPFQPVHMKVCFCPIDTSLTYSQANKLLHETNQKHLIIPDHILLSSSSNEYGLDTSLSPIVMKQPDIISLKIPRKYQPINISRELVSKLNLLDMSSEIRVCGVSGLITTRDFKYTLQTLNEKSNKKKFVRKSTEPRCFGQVDVMQFIYHLKQNNYIVKLEEMPGPNYLIELPNEDVSVQISEEGTHIITKNNEKVRKILKDFLLQSIKKIT